MCHLGHILTYNLDDKNDILRAAKDMIRKSNHLLYTFKCVDPIVKCFLLKSFCLSLYGYGIWSLSSSHLNIIQVSINHLLRRIWKLPRLSHTSICHCMSNIPAVTNMIIKHFHSLFSSAFSSSSFLVKSIYLSSSLFAPFFTGYNFMFGNSHAKVYTNVIHVFHATYV